MKSKKHKGTAKKPRINRVDSFGTLTEDGEYKLIFRPESGLELQNEAGEAVALSKVSSQLYYERESKPKVLSYSDTSIPPFVNASHMLRNYKFLSAIDTNTREVHGRSVSASIICLGSWVIEGEYTKFTFRPELYMDLFDHGGKPERYAWREFIKLIEKGSDYDGSNSFGIIVDSELGDIPDINSRKIPLYEEYYLPEKIDLIYASSDKTGTAQNHMIKTCDQWASERIDYIERRYASPEGIGEIPMNCVNIQKIEYG
jgi:hypothetical protein